MDFSGFELFFGFLVFFFIINSLLRFRALKILRYTVLLYFYKVFAKALHCLIHKFPSDNKTFVASVDDMILYSKTIAGCDTLHSLAQLDLQGFLQIFLERYYSAEVYYYQDSSGHRSAPSTPPAELTVDEIVPDFLNEHKYTLSFQLKKSLITKTNPLHKYYVVPLVSQSTRDLNLQLFSEQPWPPWRVSFLRRGNYKCKFIFVLQHSYENKFCTLKNNNHGKNNNNYFYPFRAAFELGLPSTRSQVSLVLQKCSTMSTTAPVTEDGEYVNHIWNILKRLQNLERKKNGNCSIVRTIKKVSYEIY